MTDLDRRMLLGVATVAGIAAAAAGPVTPTMKPLDQVEPRTPVQSLPKSNHGALMISQPGSYYLTGDIDVNVTGAHVGIEIAASNVTLDLCGFSMLGNLQDEHGGDCIICTAAVDFILICNGMIRNWQSAGIACTDASSVTVSQVAISNCIFAIQVGPDSRVLDSSANGNERGIEVGDSSTIARCVASHNGEHGILAGAKCVILDCTANSNNNIGIFTSDGAILRNCNASNNAINSSFGAPIGSGIRCGSGSAISGCVTNSNTGNGLSCDTGSTLVACTAASNTATGILAYKGSNVQNCSAGQNLGDGIAVDSNCLIVGCSVYGNGTAAANSAGIRSTRQGNRIDGNTVTNNTGTGILSAAGANDLVVRNTALGNSAVNYNPSTGSTFGGVAGAASSAGAWSNF